MKNYWMNYVKLAAIAAFAVAPVYAQTYHIAQTYKLGVTGGWDYMNFDSTTNKLFIAQGTQVISFDPARGAISGTLTGLNHVHGVVFDKDGTTAYVSDGGTGEVILFNRKTMAKLGAIPAGTNPDGMVIEPTTGHLFVFNGKSKNASVMDLSTKKVIATITLPGKPEFPTADGKGNVFVNIEDTHQVVKISAAENKALATWTLAGCESPTGMAIDAGAARIFPVCDNAKMPFVDINTGKIATTAPIGTGPDAVTYDPASHLLFSSNGDAGTLSIVHMDSPDMYTPVQTLKTAAKGRTLALDKQTGDIYIVAPEPGLTPAAAKLTLLKITK